MSTAASSHRPAAPAPRRAHLTLVTSGTPSATSPRRVPGRQALPALLAGLTSGFVLAAFAATLGGGSPAPAAACAGVCATFLGLILLRLRRLAVRRAARARAAVGRRHAAPAAARPAASVALRRAA